MKKRKLVEYLENQGVINSELSAALNIVNSSITCPYDYK